MKQNEIYSVFAEFYDFMDNHTGMFYEFVTKKIQKYFPNAKSILEMACGTGSVIIKFSEKYKCTGFDISTKMLEIAKNKTNKVHFFNSDMCSFEINDRFDVIFCIFDSINHLLSFEEWNKTFKNVFNHLNPGGLFIFDINSLSKINNFNHQINYFKTDKGYMIIEISSLVTNIAKWNISMFKKKGGDYSLYEEIIKETSFPIEKIKSCLTKFGEIIEIVDSDDNIAQENTKRIFFVCRK